MKQRYVAASMTAALAAALCLGGARPALAQKTLDFYAQHALKDASATLEVISKNDRELAKIGKGYVDAYKQGKREMWYKDPNRVRLQGRQGIFVIRFVTNGNRRLTEVPTLRIKEVDDISKEPSKGDSIADVGVISASWASRVESRWLRTESRGGKTLQVFEYWFREDPRYRHTIWLDPATKTVVEHIAHHRSAKKPGFKRRLVYSEPRQVNGVWFPTRAELYSPDNKLAASMRYDSIKVNTNLPDNLFTF